MSLDLFSPSFRLNPYVTYEALRQAGDAYYDSATATWFVANYAAAREVLQNPDDFSNVIAGVESTLLGADGAGHARVRKSVLPAFSSAHLNAIKVPLQDLAARFANDLAGQSFVDAVALYALKIPTAGIGWMLGIEESRWRDLSRWSAAILRTTDARRGDRFIATTSTTAHDDPRIGTIRDPDLLECHEFLLEHLDIANRQGTGGWLMDTLFRQDVKLASSELLNIVLLMIVAGTETTTDLIANSLLFLTQRPDIQNKLRADNSLMMPFLDEVLRYDSPVQRRPRYAVVDTHIGSQPILAGSKIEVVLGAANRDPAQFSQADTFCIERYPNRHLTFGAGPHFCMGSELAKIEAEAALTALLNQFSVIELACKSYEICYPENLRRRGPRELPLTLAYL